MRMPVREGLLAFVRLMREDALDAHRHALILWGLGVGGKRPPRPHAILTPEGRRGRT